MSPYGFSWIEPNALAASARPAAADELVWLREQGIQLVVSLTEGPLPRGWVNDAGLMSLHVPVADFTAPDPEQIDRVVSAVERARRNGLGVLVHCAAGQGRTGTLLATILVHDGMAARDAIARVRDLRPGSIETAEQEAAVFDYARQVRGD